MKIVFSCDLHGRKDLYDELFRYALDSRCGCIIIGGDLFPTRLAPLKMLSGSTDFNGCLHVQLAFIDSYLVPVMGSFMQGHPEIMVLYVPGNHDWRQSIHHLMQCLPGARCMHGRMETIGGITFMGYGCVTDSPFWVKDYVRRDTRDSTYVSSRYPLVSTNGRIVISEHGAYALEHPSIEEELATLGCVDPDHSVCIFHCPPFDSGLDTLHDGSPIGSRSIAGYIAAQQPLVSLHGHIHESPYMSGLYATNLGRTLSINPGHHLRQLHAVCFDTSDPGSTLTHRVFDTKPPKEIGTNMAQHRYARAIKATFMKKVLLKK